MPDVSVECASNVVHLRVCVDSCVALSDLLLYLSTQRDLAPPHSPAAASCDYCNLSPSSPGSPADASSSPHVSQSCHHVYTLDDVMAVCCRPGGTPLPTHIMMLLRVETLVTSSLLPWKMPPPPVLWVWSRPECPVNPVPARWRLRGVGLRYSWTLTLTRIMRIERQGQGESRANPLLPLLQQQPCPLLGGEGASSPTVMKMISA